MMTGVNWEWMAYRVQIAGAVAAIFVRSVSILWLLAVVDAGQHQQPGVGLYFDYLNHYIVCASLPLSVGIDGIADAWEEGL